MRVLITGACGLIGRALIAELEPAHELRLLDRLDPAQATVFVPGSAERAAQPFAARWPIVRGAITDPVAVDAAVAGCDAVIHLAAAVSGLPELGVETMRDNVLGTYVVLDACRKAGVRRFLCASSINAFGTFYWRLSGRPPGYDRLPLTESAAPVVEDPYSLSKLVNEQTAAAFSRAYGITTAAFRFAAVHTAADHARVRADLRPATAWSDDLYQWVHLADVVRGLRQALECPTLPAHGVYTLAAADTRVAQPTMELLERFRPDLVARLVRPLRGREPLLAIDAARAAFGYAPRFSFAEAAA